MADWLRRSLAPLTPEAWEEVDEAAVRVLKDQLAARTLVDFDGPHGTALGAVNLGRLEISKTKGPGGVPWGLREARPLIELRLPVTLSQMQLDNVTRGCRNTDMGPVEEGARNVALFEDTVIFNGFAKAQVKGIVESSDHKPLTLPKNAEQMPGVVGDAVRALQLAGVGGPYALVLDAKHYFALRQAGSGGYPPARIVRDLLGGELLWSPAVEGGVVLSQRGGDFVMTVGDDISIGYASETKDEVELYFHESFTFEVLEPAAAIALKVSNR